MSGQSPAPSQNSLNPDGARPAAAIHPARAVAPAPSAPGGTDEALRRFSAGVAHDLGNILTVIRGFAELLASQHCQPPELVDGLREILTAAIRAGQLGEELVVIGQRYVPESVGVDLNEVVQELLPVVKGWLDQSVQVRAELSPRPVHVLADPQGLRAMLAHVCAFAKSGMPQGGRVTLMTSRVDAVPGAGATAAGFGYLSVADTGGPLEPEHLARVFEPYYALRVLKRGTGLGPALVRGWMHVLGGRVEISARPDGMVFSLCFPLEPSAERAS